MAHLKRPIDNIDRKILTILQTEGRIQINELADRINLSKTPCLTRLRRLEAAGFIRGYRADLDPQKVSQGHLVYIQVKLESTARTSLETFNAAVRKVPEILSCHMMSGGYDYLLKVRSLNVGAYRALLGDVIAHLPGILQTSSFPVLEEVKDNAPLVMTETD